MVELANSLSTLGFIITKSREYDAQVAPVDEDSGSNPTDDQEIDVLNSASDNPSRYELVSTIRALNEDQQVELLALTWLGRGDFSVEEWPDALETARDQRDSREAIYLASTPMLGDYVEEALSELGISTEDVPKGNDE